MPTDAQDTLEPLDAFAAEWTRQGDRGSTIFVLTTLSGNKVRLNIEHLIEAADRIAMLEAENAALREALDIATAHAKKMRHANKLVGPYSNDRAASRVWVRSLYHEGRALLEKLKPFAALQKGQP